MLKSKYSEPQIIGGQTSSMRAAKIYSNSKNAPNVRARPEKLIDMERMKSNLLF